MSPERSRGSPIRTPVVPYYRWLVEEEVDPREHLGDDMVEPLACKGNDANSKSVEMF
jgi:hypothetical protein